jgi:hypothetical protein
MLELMKSMQEEMRTNGVKMDAETKAIQAETKAIQDMLDGHQEKTKTDQKSREAENKTDLEETEDTNLEANPEKMDVWMANMRGDRKGTMSCQVTTAARLESKELNSEDMKSEVEHREDPTEEAAVKSSGTMKKRQRGRHLYAGRSGEPNELALGDYGPRRKVAAACRNVSRCGAVARRKRNFFRKIRTQRSCGT